MLPSYSSPDLATARKYRHALVLARNTRRQAARERIHSRVVHPIDTPRLLPDPLERKESRAGTTVAGARWLVGAGVIHALIILGFAAVSQVVGEQRPFHEPERLTVTIVQPKPVEPPKAEEPPPVEGPIEPEFTPPPPPKPVEPPPRKPTPPSTEPPKAETTPDPAPRRVVGLSMESTVEGNGPAFATGSTRMGVTEKKAADPTQATKSPSGSSPAQTTSVQAQGIVQRAATRIPTRDAQFEEPKRIRPNKPEYPATLKAQNIEGNVVVSVDIAESGRVTRVTIIQASGYPEFDDAARRAALGERFSPAIRDGRAVPFTLSYTYRFRIED